MGAGPVEDVRRALCVPGEALGGWHVEKYEVWGGSDRLGTTWYIEILTGCHHTYSNVHALSLE